MAFHKQPYIVPLSASLKAQLSKLPSIQTSGLTALCSFSASPRSCVGIMSHVASPCTPMSSSAPCSATALLPNRCASPYDSPQNDSPNSTWSAASATTDAPASQMLDDRLGLSQSGRHEPDADESDSPVPSLSSSDGCTPPDEHPLLAPDLGRLALQSMSQLSPMSPCTGKGPHDFESNDMYLPQLPDELRNCLGLDAWPIDVRDSPIDEVGARRQGGTYEQAFERACLFFCK